MLDSLFLITLSSQKGSFSRWTVSSLLACDDTLWVSFGKIRKIPKIRLMITNFFGANRKLFKTDKTPIIKQLTTS